MRSLTKHTSPDGPKQKTCRTKLDSGYKASPAGKPSEAEELQRMMICIDDTPTVRFARNGSKVCAQRVKWIPRAEKHMIFNQQTLETQGAQGRINLVVFLITWQPCEVK